jgi:hypothetical protein
MTERERWVVYPLLFLALGAALRDKLSEQTTSKRIRCQELIVTGDDAADYDAPAPVRILAVPTNGPGSSQVGKIVVNGLIEADAVRCNKLIAVAFSAAQFFPILPGTAFGSTPATGARQPVGSSGKPAKATQRQQKSTGATSPPEK